MSDGKYKSARDLLAHTMPAPKSHRSEQRRATNHAAKGRAAGRESRAQARQQSAAGGVKDAVSGMSRGDYAQNALMTQVLDHIEATGQWNDPPAKSSSPQSSGGVFKALQQKLPDKQPTVTGRGFGSKFAKFTAFADDFLG